MVSFFELLESYGHKFADKQALITPEYVITYKQLYQTITFYQKEIISLNENKIYLKSQYAINFVIYFLSIISAGAWVIPLPFDTNAYDFDMIKNQINGIEINPEDQLVNICEKEYIMNKPDEKAAGLYHQTSGSTGNPKFCMRNIESLLYEGISYRDTLAITSDDIILNTPPLTHSYALGASLFAGLVSGSTIYLFNGFMPKTALNIIKTMPVSIVILVPFMARILAKLALKEKFDNKLRLALSGAGVIDEQLFHSFKQAFGIDLFNNYGSTETGGLICSNEKSPLLSLGKPMIGVDIKVKSEGGDELQHNETGILWIRTKALTQGYIDKTSLELDSQNYYYTGDIVKKDKENNLYYCGRVNNMINIGGKKVAPVEIENILKAFPKVKDCYIYSEKNHFHISYIIAVVVCSKNLSEADIRRICRQKLPDYKVPKKVIFVKKIPRNELGKINHAAIMSLTERKCDE